MRFLMSRTRVAALVLALAGCGESDDELSGEPVSGKVTLNGRPLEAGMVTFAPDGGREPVVSAFVKDGAFDLPRADGPVPGGHRITIWAKKPTGRKVLDRDDPKKIVDEMRDVIPRRYNLHSSLRAEVKAGRSNTFAFDLNGVQETRQFQRTGVGLTRR